jgi:tetratricopeptide (TPR) repeat protein
MRRFAVIVVGFVAACADARRVEPAPALPAGAEAWSLLGEPLFPSPLAAGRRSEREKQLEEARAMQPADSADRAIWVGRRLAYLGRFRDAIAAFTDGIAGHPQDARLYRHRGHRHVTLRRLDLAIADLERAASLIAGAPDEVEPDGQPNARSVPIGTLHSNVWYHLGLAYYLTRDDENALRSYRECMKTSDNADRLCSTSYWLYLTLRRMGRTGEARAVLEPIRADMDLVENHSYHRLLLVFRGDRSADDVLAAARSEADAVAFPTVGYGLGAWFALSGDHERARALFREILAGGNWPAFGFIAAEAEIASTRGTPESR